MLLFNLVFDLDFFLTILEFSSSKREVGFLTMRTELSVELEETIGKVDFLSLKSLSSDFSTEMAVVSGNL